MTTQAPLAAAFDARKNFHTNRASAVFPLRQRAGGDLHIVFLDYWRLKNDIDGVVVNYRLYDGAGKLVQRVARPVVEAHNQQSMAELLAATGVTGDFDGSVEVEVLSTANLSFPFPAIMGIYESNGTFSGVHSAGRIKNTDEPQKSAPSEETNWTCKFERDGDDWVVVPFFHYFNGPQPTRPGTSIEVVVRGPSAEPLSRATVAVEGMGPFASRLFRLDEVFPDLADLDLRQAFVSVRLVSDVVFPRLVVGNLYCRLEFLEVTHSFPLTEFLDYCPAPKVAAAFPSMLTAQTAPGLALDVKVFPTNCAGRFRVSRMSKGFDGRALVPQEGVLELGAAPGSDGYEFVLDEGEEFRVLALEGAEVPSRLNASYRYRVRGANSSFSTDIATGAKSSVYPPKWRHWGHGRVAGGYHSVLLYRNNTHAPASTKPNQGQLTIYGADFSHTVPVQVDAESCLSIRLDDVLRDVPQSRTGNAFVSWMLTMDEPVGETFWVCWRDDGAIFGEHGF